MENSVPVGLPLAADLWRRRSGASADPTKSGIMHAIESFRLKIHSLLHPSTTNRWPVLLLTPFAVCAQVAPPTPAATTEKIELSPFEVRTDRDTSYGALNSNSVTRFNTELDKVPISADIFTEQFMTDVGATSINELLSTY